MYKYPQVLLLALSMEMHFNSDYLGWAKNVSNGPVGEGLLLLLLEPESPPNQSGAESPTQHIAVTAGICITKAMYRPLTAMWKCGGGRQALVNIKSGHPAIPFDTSVTGMF